MELRDLLPVPTPPPDGRGAALDGLRPWTARSYARDPRLAVAVVHLRRWEAAAFYQHLVEEISHDPDFLDAYRLLAEAYQMHYRYPEARAAYDAVLKRDPSDVGALAASALMLWAFGEDKESACRLASLRELDTGQWARGTRLLTLLESIVRKPHSQLRVEPPEAIAVFGEPAMEDGGVSKGLLIRLMSALQLTVEWPDAWVILSGGAVRNRYVEANVMARWLITRGVEPTRLVLDCLALDTVGNAIGMVSIFQEFNLHRVMLVAPGTQLDRASAAVHAFARESRWPLVTTEVAAGEKASEADRLAGRPVVMTHLMRAGHFFEKDDFKTLEHD